jgi:hypothetical protein
MARGKLVKIGILRHDFLAQLSLHWRVHGYERTFTSSKQIQSETSKAAYTYAMIKGMLTDMLFEIEIEIDFSLVSRTFGNWAYELGA